MISEIFNFWMVTIVTIFVGAWVLVDVVTSNIVKKIRENGWDSLDALDFMVFINPLAIYMLIMKMRKDAKVTPTSKTSQKSREEKHQ